jgi:hypothetical protein
VVSTWISVGFWIEGLLVVSREVLYQPLPMYKVYKPSTYLVVTYFPNYLPIYIGPTYRRVTKMKPDMNSVEVHPQLSQNEHLVDGALVGCWLTLAHHTLMMRQEMTHTTNTYITQHTHIHAYHMQ